MIERLIDFSIRHRFLVLFLALALALWGWLSVPGLALDALPDPSDKQVLVYSRWDRSPEVIDLQVTSPIVAALLGAPGARSVRGISDVGASYVYVIFNDDVDLYSARARTLEYLSSLASKLPAGVETELGPDATSLGWVYQYALVDRTGTHDLTELRSYQDWYIAYQLRSVAGVAEVASVGGLVRQFQIQVDPNRLRAYGLSIDRVVAAVKNSNGDADGRVVESGGSELIVRGVGYLGTINDIAETLVEYSGGSFPVRIKDVAKVTIGADFRRGTTNLDGKGEVVSGIVVMRQGENALEVIGRVRDKLHQIQASLPAGVEIAPLYDRSELIRHAVKSLRYTVWEVVLTVSLVIIILLWHPPSALVPIVSIPLTVLIVLILMRLFGISANIMSLGGIAIAVGAMVDAGIVIVEQTHKELERNRGLFEPEDLIAAGIKKLARPAFYTLLVMAVSFLPLMALEAEEGRVFRPLAYTKSLAMLIAAALVVTVVPALRVLAARLDRGLPGPKAGPWSWLFSARIRREEEHPLVRPFVRVYEPIVQWSFKRRTAVCLIALLLIVSAVPVWFALGSEFMPEFDEGVLLYMPSTAPGISLSEAQHLLQVTNERLSKFPEVAQVFGKAGHANTATDPAPLAMLETWVTLRPAAAWPRQKTWYSNWAPEWARRVFRHITPDHISKDELIRQMNQALELPGVSNTWSMPIRGRIDMLSTGIRTKVGLKISGKSFDEVENLAARASEILASVSGTRSAFPERIAKAPYLDIRWNREALALNGVTLEDAQAAVRYAIGGENVTELLRGRERYPLAVRYAADRSSPEDIARLLVSTADGKRHIAISNLAQIETRLGPAMIRNDQGALTGYLYLDISGSDISGYIERADRLLKAQLTLPVGTSYSWAGQFEAVLRSRARLRLIIPLTLLSIVVLLYVNTRSFAKTTLILLAVPFSAVGAVWMLYLAGYHISVAVWAGLIALLGVDAGTGVYMLLYLDEACDTAKQQKGPLRPEELRQAVLEGASRRIRPKLMTTATMFFGLVPVLWSTGTGADVMKRIAAPLVGGILTSFLLELLVYPTIYEWWRQRVASRGSLIERPESLKQFTS
jgi:copper/silver efflux system protein